MKKKLSLVILTLSFLINPAAQADSCSEDNTLLNMSFSELQIRLDEKKVNSIECLIQSLPKKVKSLRTYIKSSLSLQEASLTNPRALVASPTGSFFMTFNGHAKQKGYDEIEVLALDNKDHPTKWIAGSLKLDNGQLKLKEDKRCFACHGNPIKPIWNKYPEWPNTYGSIDDWLPDPADPSKNGYQYQEDLEQGRLTDEKIKAAVKESIRYRKFQKIAKNHPRYSHLEAVTDPTSPVFPFTESYRDRNLGYRTNLILGSLMSGRHSEILKRRVQESEFFKKYTSTYLYYNTCIFNDDKNFNQKVKKFINDSYKVSYSKKLGPYSKKFKNFLEIDALNHLMGIEEHELNLQFVNSNSVIRKDELIGYFSGMNSVNEYEGFLTLDYVSKKPGLDSIINRYDQSFNEDNYDPANDGYDYSTTNYKPSRFKSAFLSFEFHNFINSFSNRSLLMVRSDQFASDQDKENHKLLCSNLKEEALEEIKTPFVFDNKTDLFSREQLWPKSLNSCIECHDSSSKIATRIPFKNPYDLSNEDRSNLVDLVYLMTSETLKPAHLNGRRMPLGRSVLKDVEIKEIVEWINK